VLKAALFPDKSISIFGEDYPTKDGSCVRDYVHVRDIAQAHILALTNMSHVNGEAFNLGSGQGYSVKEIVAEAKRITGKPIQVEMKPRPGSFVSQPGARYQRIEMATQIYRSRDYY
jgi:UDP-glucose 4-epimerase